MHKISYRFGLKAGFHLVFIGAAALSVSAATAQDQGSPFKSMAPVAQPEKGEVQSAQPPAPGPVPAAPVTSEPVEEAENPFESMEIGADAPTPPPQMEEAAQTESQEEAGPATPFRSMPVGAQTASPTGQPAAENAAQKPSKTNTIEDVSPVPLPSAQAPHPAEMASPPPSPQEPPSSADNGIDQAPDKPADTLGVIGQESYEFEPFSPATMPVEGVSTVAEEPNPEGPNPESNVSPANPEEIRGMVAQPQGSQAVEVPPAPPIEPAAPEPAAESPPAVPAQSDGWSNPDASGGDQPISDGLDPMRDAMRGN